MTRFAVDPTALPAIATAVRQAADIADSAASEHRSLPVTSLADPTLVAALGRFTDSWSPRLHDLAGDARRIADALEAAAQLYQDVEAAAQVALASPAGALRAAAPPPGRGAGDAP